MRLSSNGFLVLPCLIHSTFAWNFIDVYLIIISILLTEKLSFLQATPKMSTWISFNYSFKAINRKLKTSTRLQNKQFWEDMWSAHRTSVELVEKTNKLNGGTVLISFFSNMYFICVQLLGCFKSETSFLDGLYLWFSLIFLIGRTLAVSMEEWIPIVLIFHV